MARNAPRVLTLDEIENSARWESVLTDYANANVSVEISFIKRNGEFRVISGPIEEFVGVNDTRAVTVVTDKGMRSANTWAILDVVSL